MVDQKKYEKIVLCADIGGTNANFSIVGFNKSKRSKEIIFFRRENIASVTNFPDLVNSFLEYVKKEYSMIPQEACFAVAGPVENKKDSQIVRMTNTKLIIDSRQIKRKTPLKIILIINDFEAISYAINVLGKKDYTTINKGKSVAKGTRIVVGAGTGLGKSILCFNETINAYIPIPSEGGHGDLLLLDEEEAQLAVFIKKKRELKYQISYEEVLSGRGLEILYQYLSKTRFHAVPGNLSAKEISRTKKTNACSEETFAWFVKFYARCCRNFVLDALATGGLYIAGGIATKNAEIFSKNFLEEFTKNEAHSRTLKNIPIHVITNYNISHLGAAYALVIH